jgi:hypothetical protein
MPRPPPSPDSSSTSESPLTCRLQRPCLRSPSRSLQQPRDLDSELENDARAPTPSRRVGRRSGFKFRAPKPRTVELPQHREQACRGRRASLRSESLAQHTRTRSHSGTVTATQGIMACGPGPGPPSVGVPGGLIMALRLELSGTKARPEQDIST